MRIRSRGLGAPADEVEITFAGRPLRARATDTVASALTAAGELACRETLDGDQRGLFCGMGVCQECLVAIDGEPGQRACMTPVRAGMTVDRQPARPDLASLAAAHGARDAAGATASDAGAPPSPLSVIPPRPKQQPRELACELLVVGGGPAGLAAAVAAAEAGISVVLADERPKPGGQYYKQPPEALVDDASKLDPQYRSGRSLIARARAAGVDLRSGLQVWGAPSRDELLATDADGEITLRPRALILATGAYERGVPLPGWTLPGVMSTGAAQTLLRAYQVSPGTRVLVSGNGPLNMQVAAELVKGGAKVVALAELARLTDPRRLPAVARMAAAAPDLILQGAGYGAALARARVPVLHGRALIRAEGDGRVQRATVAKIAADGTPVAGSEKSYEVDAVCVGFGFLPSNELARSLGAAHRFDAVAGGFAVDRHGDGRTSVEDLWVVGDGGGIGGARVAQAAGLLAGLDAARSLGRTLGSVQAQEEASARRDHARARRFQHALWSAYAAPRLVDQLAEPQTPICRCENVPLSAVQEAFASGIGHIGAVKRVTRAGMGGCQGRYCGGLLAEVGARAAGRELDEHDLFAPSAPFKPLPIDAIAERP
ncbi:2Fe-2S iron-sulfur cluster-binding protein [Conexibacter sp. JD483]|uniref:FAD-dependent oxidoreductase n=1 Tax=unclassified Conexibacter TaxID=2627773 RepID=UPI00271E6B51|nr:MULTISPECIES: FAD-dependent oxidoreductase [unclassified Conexibacter]MDO8185270.1 2Fe-2S iron-sulfur cluster-binding protein [Conexibacter sp. CPCC 205706]MDO8198316.1 2Fe-2S iron-sulfur cluster-binding protein [Conexibacter sp. CPCC 205762]MDR9367723.1 2Fe-2S iron-sulfur cluster-binding protein [Conexibacter sp. JD483]